MSDAVLEVRDLVVAVGAREILHGVSLRVDAGRAVAIMGPNGSGKSTLVRALFGRPGYEQRAGAIVLGGKDVSAEPTFERARRGMSLIEQDPIEIPGVRPATVAAEALAGRGLDPKGAVGLLEREADEVALDRSLLERWYNVELSGGERKKLETAMAALVPGLVVVGDEIDSGLDVDALRVVARRLDALRRSGRGLLLVTHYPRLLRALQPDAVVVLVEGRIVDTGAMDLAERIEREGYRPYGVADEG